MRLAKQLRGSGLAALRVDFTDTGPLALKQGEKLIGEYRPDAIIALTNCASKLFFIAVFQVAKLDLLRNALA